MANDESPLFYERVKKHGKWIFLALAVVFAGSFVLGGVGGGGIGVVDLIQQQGGDDNNSATTASAQTAAIDEAEAGVKAEPESAAAWTTLAEAALQEENPTRAREAAQKAQGLVGKDADVAERLASVWLNLLGSIQDRQTTLQNDLFAPLANAQQGPDQAVVPLGSVAGEDAFTKGVNEVSNAINTRYFARVAPLQEESTEAQQNALASYRIIVDQRPDDPAAWFQLGRIAEALGETDTAIEAYEKFLQIVPGDPQAPQVQQQLDGLKPATTAADTAATTEAAATDAAATDAATTDAAATAAASTG